MLPYSKTETLIWPQGYSIFKKTIGFGYIWCMNDCFIRVCCVKYFDELHIMCVGVAEPRPSIHDVELGYDPWCFSV